MGSFQLFFIWLGIGLLSGALASRVAMVKQAESVGFLYGFLLGPFGVVAAGFLDDRSQCQRCGGRLNGRYAVCNHCHTRLDWAQSQPQAPEMVEPLPEAVKAEPFCGGAFEFLRDS